MLFLVIAGSPVAAADDPTTASTIMRPGMVFRDLMYPLNPLGGADCGILTAVTAEIREPPNLLRIEGLRLSRSESNRSFDLHASSAVYDWNSGIIRVEDGFQGKSCGFLFKGIGLCGNPKNLTFEMSGSFEIQMKGLVPMSSDSVGPRRMKTTPFEFHSLRSSWFWSGEDMTPLNLVRQFSGDFTTFVKCWEWVENPDSFRSICPSASFAILSLKGGWLDFRRNEMQLAGQSAVLGPNVVLISAKGIHWHQEKSDGKPMMRVSGRGGIKAWMHPPQSDETWISSNLFDYVSDGNIIQFKGGPVVLMRKGVTLEATESWQFVRVFNRHRIVLSPGSWHMTGGFAELSE